MPAAFEKFSRQIEALICVVNTQNRDSIIPHSELRRSEAYVGPIEMKMRQVRIKSQAGGLPQDQDDLVERLNLRRLGRASNYSLSGGIHIATELFVGCYAAAT